MLLQGKSHNGLGRGKLIGIGPFCVWRGCKTAHCRPAWAPLFRDHLHLSWLSNTLLYYVRSTDYSVPAFLYWSIPGQEKIPTAPFGKEAEGTSFSAPWPVAILMSDEHCRGSANCPLDLTALLAVCL